MRKVARVRITEVGVRWVIVHQTEGGVHVFPCASDEDGSVTGDDWYPSLSDADAACADAYGVECGDWRLIGDPPQGCQQDWVSPVRVRGRESGNPQWGEFERLVDGSWTIIDSSNPAPTIEEAIQQAHASEAAPPRR